MNLRIKSFMIVGATLAGLIIILSIVLSGLTLEGFSKLERDDGLRQIERAVNALEAEMDGLASTIGDWAAWDDTYAFVQKPSAKYVEANLADSTFINLRLNVMLFVSESGRTVWSRAFDLNEQKTLAVPAALRELPADDGLLRHDDQSRGRTGLLVLPEGMLMAASHPITTSDRKGPPRGCLIMGRFLGPALIERFVKQTSLSLVLADLNDARLAPDLAAARAFLSKAGPGYIRPLDKDRVAGYTLLKDFYGNPALLLRIDQPRFFHRQARIVLNYLDGALGVTALVACLIVMLLIEKLILRRVSRLSAEVGEIGVKRDLSARVSVDGADELGGLAVSINRSFADLEASEQALKRVQDQLLETRVSQRTVELRGSNEELRREVEAREKIEQELKAALREKELLLREIHHRVKNNLQVISSLLSLQSQNSAEPSIKAVLGDSQSRIQSMALVHELLYRGSNGGVPDLARVRFSGYIRAMSLFQLDNHKIDPGRIGLRIFENEVELDIDTAIPCGLIVNELLSNAFKHAFPDDRKGEVAIDLSPAAEDELTLTVSDDGVGLPADFDARRSDGTGWRIVNSLVQQLNGRLEIERGRGTTVHFSFWV